MKLSQIFRAGLQSSTIMSAADIATQLFIEGKSLSSSSSTSSSTSTSKTTTIQTSDEIIGSLEQQDQQVTSSSYDFHRTLRWTFAGLTLHGPYFFMGFSLLDKHFGTIPSWKLVTKKTVFAQCVLFPPYLVALFSLMGLLEGHSDILSKIQHHVPQAFIGGCVYWPIANGINFTFVSPTLRIPYLAASAGIWNSYLSWSNAKD